MTNDLIHIRDLSERCIIGVRPKERHRKQRVVINLALQCDSRRAGATDDLRHTVDYAAVSAAVRRLVAASRCLLVERLAQQVADTCLGFPGVQAVTVILDKPGAVTGDRSVAVEITRSRRRP